MDTKEAGRLGGKARAKKLTKKRRIEIAKKAVAAREAKKLPDPKQHEQPAA
jgi:hypothetical protein